MRGFFLSEDRVESGSEPLLQMRSGTQRRPLYQVTRITHEIGSQHSQVET